MGMTGEVRNPVAFKLFLAKMQKGLLRIWDTGSSLPVGSLRSKFQENNSPVFSHLILGRSAWQRQVKTYQWDESEMKDKGSPHHLFPFYNNTRHPWATAAQVNHILYVRVLISSTNLFYLTERCVPIFLILEEEKDIGALYERHERKILV